MGVELKEPLGKGNFGQVWKGILEGQEVAVKLLQKRGAIRELIQEMSLMGYLLFLIFQMVETYSYRGVKHANIIEYKKFIPDCNAIGKEYSFTELEVVINF
jgi:hypothetical protein